MSRRRVAVLGAGIMGSCLAINLARRGAEVTLIDRNDQPVTEASRFNEGKIHLGYLYGADASLQTARHILSGGLVFGALMSELLECDVAAQSTAVDDTYLVDRDSLVSQEELRSYFDEVSRLVREHPDASRYLTDVSHAAVRPLRRAELDSIATERIVAGFRVPERSIDTRWLADRLAAAVVAQPRLTFLPGTVVTGVTPYPDSEAVAVAGAPGFAERFDVVVNALWAGRIQIDLTAGLRPERSWTHRVRQCLFVSTRTSLDVPSSIVVQGPFGDVKNYNGRDFYLSWYPVGLVAEGSDVSLDPPPLPSGEAKARFIEAVRLGLGAAVPRIGEILDAAQNVTVAGGHVFAEGCGSIGNPASGLHRRDRFGVTRVGNYISVDTGKYSTAPWLAARLAADLTGSR